MQRFRRARRSSGFVSLCDFVSELLGRFNIESIEHTKHFPYRSHRSKAALYLDDLVRNHMESMALHIAMAALAATDTNTDTLRILGWQLRTRTEMPFSNPEMVVSATSVAVSLVLYVRNRKNH